MNFNHLRAITALAALLWLAVPASAHSLGPNFTQAVDLGTTTDWDATGVRSEAADIPDVEGWGANYFRFRVVEPGPVLVWTSGGFSPRLQVFDGSGVEVGHESSSRREVVVDAGLHYVRAQWQSAGAYRLHVAGGGRGHDDVGNTVAQAAPVPSCRDRASGNPRCKPSSRPRDVESWDGREALALAARIDYEGDLDWYQFDVPEGPPVRVRMWSSGGTYTNGLLLNEYEAELVEDYSGDYGGNFSIDRSLEPGTYYLRLSAGGRTGAYRLHWAGLDDHGNFFETASWARWPTDPGIPGEIDDRGDIDLFWFQVSTAGDMRISSSGIYTNGTLYDEYEVELVADYSGSYSGNFSIDRSLEPGIYFVRVSAGSGTGPYNLHLSGDASGVLTVPLLPADGNAHGQQGFVRVTNHSEYAAEVAITAVDDTGMRSGLSSPLALAPWQTRHFNSRDLERGNTAKGIASGGVGNGTGNWYLEVAPSRADVEVLSYIRTRDGFLTSMHAQAPNYGRTHRVAVFNPGSNRNQASRLRLINLKCPSLDPCEAANVTIYGVDDDGMRSPDVRLAMATGTARELTAAQLEGIDHADDLEGSLGNGAGKWQLFVTADRPIQVMSLLESASGHLTNLSAPTSRQVFAAPPRQE